MDWLTSLLQNFFNWKLMWETVPDLLVYGLRNTLILSLSSCIIGAIFGMLLAIMGVSQRSWLRLPARVYVDIFRGLPAILTILLLGQGFAQVGMQMFGPNPYPLAIFALSLIAAAYIGEIFRAGIQSIEKGQGEACRALGMTYGQAMRLVIVPQGVRRVLPALVNQFIGIIKDSSLVYFLGLLTTQRELFRVGQDATVNSGNLSPLVAAGAFYLLLTVPLTHFVNYIDKRLRTGRRIEETTSGLDEVDELATVITSTGVVEKEGTP